jgi:hypothetical protein
VNDSRCKNCSLLDACLSRPLRETPWDKEWRELFGAGGGGHRAANPLNDAPDGGTVAAATPEQP